MEPYHSYDPQVQPPYPGQPPKTNGKSIAALVLGILSVVVPYVGLILGVIAIVMGKLSLNEIRRTQEQGKGLAVAGLVCGIVGTAVYAIIIIFFIIALFAFVGVRTPGLINL